MPAPAALLVAAGITALASNPVFIHFVYDPIIAPTLERLAESYIEQRRGRSRRPAAPVEDLPQPGADDRNDIPLNGMRRRRLFTYTSTSYENGDEGLGLLMVQTAREPDENVDANMTLRRRPITAVPVIDNTILEESSLLFEVQSSTTAREPNENVDADATLQRRPVVAVPVVDNTTYEESSSLPAVQSPTITREPDEYVDADATLHRRPVAPLLVVDNTTPEESSSLLLGVQGSTTAREPNLNENINSTATPPRRPDSVDNNNNFRFGSKRRTPLVPVQNKKLRPQPTVAVSGLSFPVVPEWKTIVSQDPLGLHEERRRKDQVQWMNSVVDRRPLPASSTIPTVSAVPTAPVPSSSLPTVFHVSDELNPVDTLPQTSICPTHLITNSSVPSTPSSTTSSARNVVFTPPSQVSVVSPLFSGTASTSAGVNGANPSETCVLDPSVSPLAIQDGLDVPVSVSVSSVAQSSASLQTDASSDSSSTFQFSLLRNAPRAPQLPPLPNFSPLCVPSMSLSPSTHSTHSNQHTSPTLQSPPQPPSTPPHFTPSAQHPHCVHYPAPPNVTAVPSSEIYQKHRFASPGVMSSKLSELDFISE